MTTIRKSRKVQLGFTISEIMIALGVSAILLGGVLQIYIGSKQSYRVQNALAELQENARFAIEKIATDIRIAGYQGCSNLDAIAVDSKMASANALSFEPSTILNGYEFDGSDWTPEFSGTAPAPVFANTDVLSVLAGSSCSARLNKSMSSESDSITVKGGNRCGFEENQVLLVTDCANSTMFVATDVSTDADGNLVIRHEAGTGNASGSVSKAFDKNAQIMALTARDYFVGPNADGNSALYQRDLSAPPEEVVEGAENMQILYGEVNALSNTIAFVEADSVTNWDMVKSVRINLLFQTVAKNLHNNPRSRFFDGALVADASDGRLRREFSTTVRLRNRID